MQASYQLSFSQVFVKQKIRVLFEIPAMCTRRSVLRKLFCHFTIEFMSIARNITGVIEDSDIVYNRVTYFRRSHGMFWRNIPPLQLGTAFPSFDRHTNASKTVEAIKKNIEGSILSSCWLIKGEYLRCKIKGTGLET